VAYSIKKLVILFIQPYDLPDCKARDALPAELMWFILSKNYFFLYQLPTSSGPATAAILICYYRY